MERLRKSYSVTFACILKVKITISHSAVPAEQTIFQKSQRVISKDRDLVAGERTWQRVYAGINNIIASGLVALTEQLEHLHDHRWKKNSCWRSRVKLVAWPQRSRSTIQPSKPYVNNDFAYVPPGISAMQFSFNWINTYVGEISWLLSRRE